MGNADARWKLLVGEVIVSQPSAAGHTGTGGHHAGVARELNTVSKFGHGVLATCGMLILLGADRMERARAGAGGSTLGEE